MKTLKDPVFEPETIGDLIVRFISTILFLFFIVLIFIAIISLITIFGVQTASAIWGDANVIYWISNLF